MSKKNGTDILIYVETSPNVFTAVGGSVTNTLSINGEVIDVTTKDSQGWRELLQGLRSWSMSGEGKFDDASTFGFEELFAKIEARTAVTIRFTDETLGETYYEGGAFVTSLEKTAPLEDATTFSFTFEGTGALTEDQVAS